MTPKKLLLLGAALVLVVLASRWPLSRREASPPVVESVGSSDASGGALLSEKVSAPTAVSTPAAVAPARGASQASALLARLSATPLDSKTEEALRSVGGGKSAKDLGLFLRLRRAKTAFTAEEMRVLENSVLGSLQENAEDALVTLGRTLSGLEGDVECRESRMDLLALAATLPARENPEISRSALASLSETYAADSGVKPEERFDLAVIGLQAFLATSRLDAAGTNAAVARAMGGRIDPAIKTVYRNMLLDRFPAPR